MIYLYRIKLIGWFLGIFITGMFVGMSGFKISYLIGSVLIFIYWHFYNQIKAAQERRDQSKGEVSS